MMLLDVMTLWGARNPQQHAVRERTVIAARWNSKVADGQLTIILPAKIMILEMIG